jgi:hypothetical protein
MIVIENMLSWHHSGFHVYIGDRITPSDKNGLGNLARYIIRACFSQERMVYIPAEESADGIAKVVYTSKDGKTREVFNALDWLARLVTHIPITVTCICRHNPCGLGPALYGLAGTFLGPGHSGLPGPGPGMVLGLWPEKKEAVTVNNWKRAWMPTHHPLVRKKASVADMAWK